MNKLLLALITAAFATVGAYAADTAKPEAAAASAPKKESTKKHTKTHQSKKAHAPAAAASK